jgi:class 3 adenylate cyclase
MTLVERFIEFDRWPVSRKTAVISGFMMACHGVANLAGELTYDHYRELIDIPFFRSFTWGWFACVTLAFLASTVPARRGLEARWTAWLLIVPYALFLVGTVYAFGPMTSPFLAWLAMIGLIVVMIWGLKTGLRAIVIGFLLMVALVAAPFGDLLPYAPILHERSLEAIRQNGWYVSTVAFVNLLTFGACLFILVLLISAKNLQEFRLERATHLIRRYVPSQLAEKIIAGEHGEGAKPERAKLTIFFSDLVGFSALAEELEPEDLARVLNDYFASMMTVAEKHGGTVDEISGDAILIFFGAPKATNDRDHALRAARMAIEMQGAMDGLNAKWRAAGIAQQLQVRMGLDTGVVTIGNFGSPDRMKYAALGKPVNLAARLQAQCEPGRALVSQATWLLVSDQVKCVKKGELQLKGFHKPVMAYELLPA